MAEFKEGDKVLAYHRNLIYDAKILKSKESSGVWSHFVHYLKWNKKWDEWVPEDRVMGRTEANLALQREVNEWAKPKAGADPKGNGTGPEGEEEDDEMGGGAGGGAAASAASGGKKKSRKRKIDATHETIEADKSVTQMKIPLSYLLKKHLVDDWEAITQRKCLQPLPRPITVANIFEEYLATKRKGKPDDKVLPEVVEGLRLYFDKALGTFLLYRFERKQFETFVEANPDAPMSEVYGAEHMLRLFVKLPSLLAQTALDAADLRQLQMRFVDFVKYFQRNSGRFFTNDYEAANEEYLEDFKTRIAASS